MKEVIISPYKTVGDVTLNMHIIRSERSPDTPLRPPLRPPLRTPAAHAAIIFFFCGGWNAFDGSKFYPQGRYLASRGAVCFNAEVRVEPIHGTSPVECVIDAKSAVRWVRAHADDLGVMKNRIVAAGGSAAGHVSACSGVINGYDDPLDEHPLVSSRPDALVLFNPTLDITCLERRVSRFGGIDTARSLSPLHHITRGVPPSLVMHGRDDSVVDVEEAIRFEAAMTAEGNRCDLRLYDRQEHGFFNYFDGRNPMFTETLKEMDMFLTSIGFLSGEERVENSFGSYTR